MKKLQNNFTAPEQSKRLLELGVPADSADCYMKLNGTDIMLWDQPNRYTMSLSRFISRAKEYAGSEVYIPCWSVGRLIEIALICATKIGKPYINFSTSRGWSPANNIDYMMSIFVNYSSTYMDFSKLED